MPWPHLALDSADHCFSVTGMMCHACNGRCMRYIVQLLGQHSSPAVHCPDPRRGAPPHAPEMEKDRVAPLTLLWCQT